MNGKEPETFSEAETERRSDVALKRLLNTRPQPRVRPEVKEGESKKRGRPPKPKDDLGH